MSDVRETYEKWRKVTEGKEDMEDKLLRLLRHKDATTEQLREVHKLYTNVCELYLATKENLMLKYPDKGTGPSWPWNRRG